MAEFGARLIPVPKVPQLPSRTPSHFSTISLRLRKRIS